MAFNPNLVLLLKNSRFLLPTFISVFWKQKIGILTNKQKSMFCHPMTNILLFRGRQSLKCEMLFLLRSGANIWWKLFLTRKNVVKRGELSRSDGDLRHKIFWFQTYVEIFYCHWATQKNQPRRGQKWAPLDRLSSDLTPFEIANSSRPCNKKDQSSFFFKTHNRLSIHCGNEYLSNGCLSTFIDS